MTIEKINELEPSRCLAWSKLIAYCISSTELEEMESPRSRWALLSEMGRQVAG